MLKRLASGETVPDLIPGLVKLVRNDIGDKILRNLGHIAGKPLGKAKPQNDDAVSVLLALKTDRDNSYGLGYDPYKNAKEFKKPEKGNPQKKQRTDDKGGFGIGIFEEVDEMDEYTHTSKVTYSNTLDDEEDEIAERKRQLQKPKEPIKKRGVDGFVFTPTSHKPEKM